LHQHPRGSTEQRHSVLETIMPFTIGNQTAGVINNVDGNQTINGLQQGIAVTDGEARAASADLKNALLRAPLSTRLSEQALWEASQLDAELHRTVPDKPGIAERLKRLVALVVAGGSLATGSTAIVTAVSKLGHGWAGWARPFWRS
jgi:hypothetical protein